MLKYRYPKMLIPPIPIQSNPLPSSPPLRPNHSFEPFSQYFEGMDIKKRVPEREKKEHHQCQEAQSNSLCYNPPSLESYIFWGKRWKDTYYVEMMLSPEHEEELRKLKEVSSFASLTRARVWERVAWSCISPYTLLEYASRLIMRK